LFLNIHWIFVAVGMILVLTGFTVMTKFSLPQSSTNAVQEQSTI
jgi:Ni,Fe-hydrogenase I cytochrome b subunit